MKFYYHNASVPEEATISKTTGIYSSVLGHNNISFFKFLCRYLVLGTIPSRLNQSTFSPFKVYYLLHLF